MKLKKQILPTATVSEARLRIFQPSQKPVYKEITVHTEYGTATVKGRLGQRHADLFEAIRVCARAKQETTDGFMLLVEPYEIRKMIGTGYYSYEQMQKLLTELRAATVIIETKKYRITGGLIDYFTESLEPLKDKRGNDIYPLLIKLGPVARHLLNNDLKLYYDPVPISHLKSGTSQAIARHIATHKHAPAGGWHMDTLIAAVAGDINGTKLRDARRAIRNDSQALEKIGIYITDCDRITLKSVG
jgi:hypothetical protein